MTGMTCFYVFFEGLFMRKIVVTKLTDVPVEMKVVIHIRSFKQKFQESTPPKKCLPIKMQTFFPSSEFARCVT